MGDSARGVLTLTTDFGLQDPYVGSMKGVIFSIAPEVRIVDLTHLVPPGDVANAAYQLWASYKYYPPGTVHVAVVDPGVGTNRRPVGICAVDQFFVGPDNGIFSLVLDEVSSFQARELASQKYRLPHLSSTFHGRDLFAPAGAWLARGLHPKELGPEVQDLVRLPTRLGVKTTDDGNVLEASVVQCDRFGNVITGIQADTLDLTALEMLRTGNREIKLRCDHYDEIPDGELAVLVGSAGLLEISMKGASAAESLSVKIGDPVRIVVGGEKREK